MITLGSLFWKVVPSSVVSRAILSILSVQNRKAGVRICCKTQQEEEISQLRFIYNAVQACNKIGGELSILHYARLYLNILPTKPGNKQLETSNLKLENNWW